MRRRPLLVFVALTAVLSAGFITAMFPRCDGAVIRRVLSSGCDPMGLDRADVSEPNDRANDGPGKDINDLPAGLTPSIMLVLFAVGGLIVLNIFPGLTQGSGEEFGWRGLTFTLMLRRGCLQ